MPGATAAISRNAPPAGARSTRSAVAPAGSRPHETRTSRGPSPRARSVEGADRLEVVSHEKSSSTSVTATVLAASVTPRGPGLVNLIVKASGNSSSPRSEEHTSELQSLAYLVCRLLLEKKKKIKIR